MKMVGDIVIACLLLLLFTIEIISGIIIMNSSSGLTPALRKTDGNLARAYNQYNIAGQISLYMGIVGVVIIIASFFFLGFKPDAFDNISRTARIIIKSIYGLIVIILTVLISYYLYEAKNSILTSHTYKLSRLNARQEFDSSVFYTELSSGFYLFLAVLFIILFIAMGIYDSSKKENIIIIDDSLMNPNFDWEQD